MLMNPWVYNRFLREMVKQQSSETVRVRTRSLGTGAPFSTFWYVRRDLYTLYLFSLSSQKFITYPIVYLIKKKLNKP